MKTWSQERLAAVGRTLWQWIVATILLVMLVRLFIVALRFSGIAFTWLIEGELLAWLAGADPWKLTINLALVAILLLSAAFARRAKNGEDHAE